MQLAKGAKIFYFEKASQSKELLKVLLLSIQWQHFQRARKTGQELLFKGLAEDQGVFQQQFFILPGTAPKHCAVKKKTNKYVNLNRSGKSGRMQI